MNELALFAGGGGGLLGSRLLGWRPVCAVEIDTYCQRSLLQRQRDKCLEAFPIWDDVRTFDGRPWRGVVDIITGGFPCQDISVAGKGAGITGKRSGLWSEFARIIGEVRPRYALVENSPKLTSRGLGRVLGDLAELGFDARWGVVAAQDAIWSGGAPRVYHERGRIWILAEDANARRCEREQRPDVDLQRRWVGDGRSEVSASNDASIRRHGPSDEAIRTGRRCALAPSWWRAEPELGRVAHGVANRLDRIRAIGNGQVPAVVVRAWHELTQQSALAAKGE